MGMSPDITESEKITQATLACVGLGVGEVVGGMSYGRIEDTLGTRFAGTTIMIEWVVACAVAIWYTYVNVYSFWFAFVMSFFWGVQDCGLNAFQFSVCGFQFDDMTAAFAVYYLFKSVTGFLCIYLESMLHTQEAYLIYWYAVTAFGIFAWSIFLFGFKLKSKAEDSF